MSVHCGDATKNNDFPHSDEDIFDSHIPVLAEEILSFFKDRSISFFLDGTIGAGGHARLILQEHPEIIEYTALDQDSTALKLASSTLEPFKKRVLFYHTNFSQIPHQAPAHFDGALIDIGVSSMQLDTPERGFSFMHDGPLDMRMNQEDSLLMTAEDVVNSTPQKELADIFYKYGEEHLSRPIAKMICERRKKERFTTTLQLASAIESIIPRRGKAHPATKVFQALRIYVNQELDVLEKALFSIAERLNPHGGRLCVITFHSLEDRIVKQAFQKMSKEGLSEKKYILPIKKPLEACIQEIRKNRRSRSAKLRVIERSE